MALLPCVGVIPILKNIRLYLNRESISYIINARSIIFLIYYPFSVNVMSQGNVFATMSGTYRKKNIIAPYMLIKIYFLIANSLDMSARCELYETKSKTK